MPISQTKVGHRPDYFLLAIIAILTIFGLAILSSASSEVAKLKFNDSYFYIRHQVINGLLLGLLGFLAGYFFYYQRFKKAAFALLILGIAALTLVFTNLGIEIRGANRWVVLGPISFQPAELIKLVYIIYLAAWLSNPRAKRAENFSEGLLPFFLVSGLIGALLVLQPATTTTIIILATGLAVYALSGAKWRYILATTLIGAIGAGLLVYATPYRWARVLTFLNPETDVEGQSYHINQALFAISSGGLTGLGYGQSATKASYLPTPMDDSIFAVIAEEMGFVGASAIIVLFALLVLRLFWLAKLTRDNFGRLLLVGFGSLIAIQSFVNMAAISGLIPLTGVPLPFVSYGGTALAVFLIMGGISLNISKYA